MSRKRFGGVTAVEAQRRRAPGAGRSSSSPRPRAEARIAVFQEFVLAAERIDEVAADELLGDVAGLVRRHVQLRRERIHEAARARRSLPRAHVAEAVHAGGDLLVVQVVDPQANLCGPLGLDHRQLRADFHRARRAGTRTGRNRRAAAARS